MIPIHFQFQPQPQPQPQRGRGKPTGGRRRALEVRRGVAGGPRGAGGWRRRASALVLPCQLSLAGGARAFQRAAAVPVRRGREAGRGATDGMR